MLNLSKYRIDEEFRQKYKLYSLETLSTPRTGIILSRWIRGILVVFVGILFLPWQQNIDGKGTITAFSPESRPQNIQNIIAGRIEKWKFSEGQFVKKGDTLLVISETKDDYFDPKILERTNQQITAKNASVSAYNSKILSLENQLNALKNGQNLSLQKAKNKLKQSQLKVISDSTDYQAILKNYKISQERLLRFENGYKEGLFSLTDLETRRLKVQEDYAKVISQENKLGISRNELINARVEVSSVEADYQKDIAKAISDKN